jgi:hypothetical protein
VVHHVVVPRPDVSLFEQFASDRTRIQSTHDFLPSRFLSTYSMFTAARRIPRLGRRIPAIEAVNIRRPWPPIRGWILQQIVKLAAVSRIDADVVVIADSDVALIRPLTVDDFRRNDAVRFYRSATPLTPDLERHATWHQVSRTLLGLPTVDEHLDADYVTSFIAWDPRVVRRLQARIEVATGQDWTDAIGRQLHFSEYMLYACFVENLGTDRDRSFTESDTLCHSCWGTTPLNRRTGEEFVSSVKESDLAVHVQSRTNTPLKLRREIIAASQAKYSSS